MLPTLSIEKFLQYAPEPFKEIVLELRNIVVDVAPSASEVILWKGIAYYDEKRGGPVSAGICHISVQPDHVRLAFLHGAFLPDPRGLLEGHQKAKRYLCIRSYEDAPWDYLKELISDSFHFDPHTLSPGRKIRS
jgi:hypothetical protein